MSKDPVFDEDEGESIEEFSAGAYLTKPVYLHTNVERQEAHEALERETAGAHKKEWIVRATCPVHHKPVFIIVQASDIVAAESLVEGKTISCPYTSGVKIETKIINKSMNKAEYERLLSEGWHVAEVLSKYEVKLAKNHTFVAHGVSVVPRGRYQFSSAKEAGYESLDNAVWRNPKTGEIGVLTFEPPTKKKEGEANKNPESFTVVEAAKRREAVTAEPETKVIDKSELETYIKNGWKQLYTYANGKIAVTKLVVTKLSSSTINVAVSRKETYITKIYPAFEVQLFDQLMAQANKQYLHNNAGRAGRQPMRGGQIETYPLKNGLLALMLTHGGTTSTYATGFLQAVGFQDVGIHRVREQLARLHEAGIIYQQQATFKTKFPNPPTLNAPIIPSIKIVQKPQEPAGAGTHEQILGEAVYYINSSTRQAILQKFRTTSGYQWWTAFEPSPTMKKLNISLTYIWIKTTSEISRFKSKDDLLIYGPFHRNTLQKIPLNDAQNLVATKQATLLNQNISKPKQPQPEPSKPEPKKKKKGELDFYAR